MKKEMYIAPSVEIVKVNMESPLAAGSVKAEESIENVGSSNGTTGKGVDTETGTASEWTVPTTTAQPASIWNEWGD